MPKYQIIRPLGEKHFIELEDSFHVAWTKNKAQRKDFLEVLNNGNIEYIGINLLKNSIVTEIIEEDDAVEEETDERKLTWDDMKGLENAAI